MSIGAGKPLFGRMLLANDPAGMQAIRGGRAYADQHTLDPTTSRQLLPPFAREMTCQVYDSALGAWGCLIPAFESTLPGRLSPPCNTTRGIASAIVPAETSLPALAEP